jgi:uroporphyrinogen decarboxylase
MPVYLQALKLIADYFAKPLAVSPVGPFTLAVELAGATDLTRSIIRNPDFVEELMIFTTDVVLNFAIEVSKTGAKLIQISEPSAVILSPGCLSGM